MIDYRWQVSSNKYTVSAIKVLVPSLKVPALGPKPPKIPKGGVVLNSALGGFTAQAPSESVRGPKFIGKRKLRASDGPKVLENVSSERPRAQQYGKT